MSAKCLWHSVCCLFVSGSCCWLRISKELQFEKESFMSRYRKIFVKMWGDIKFRNLSASGASAQTLWFFLLTSPLTTRIPGISLSGEAGFSESMNWSLESFRKVFQEICMKGMVRSDWQARLIWVPKAILYNKPENPNVVRGWKDTWNEIPECSLKLEIYEELKEYLQELGEGFVKAFEEACLKPLPNQEQEQEQDIPPSEGVIKNHTSKNSSLEEIKQTKSFENKLASRGTHPRLKIFVDEYLLSKGQEYIIGDYRAEGGAAKRTHTKIPDDENFRQAVRAYLANPEKRLTENGHPFLWFIRDLNRWAIQAQGDTHEQRKSNNKYDDLYE